MTETVEPKVTPTQLLAELRGIIDRREDLAKQDRDLSKRKQEIERELIEFHESSGLDRIAGSGVTVGFDPQAVRFRYDPEKWGDIVGWAIRTNNLHVVQRRLTDAKILELIGEGVALPEGLTMETYTAVSIRRK